MERALLRSLAESTGCARERGGIVFLVDPSWGPVAQAEAERLQAAAEVRPEGEGRGWLALPSGGAGGAVKWARHDEQTLAAAVAGFRAHFGLGAVHAVDVLPPQHVSGFMARIRCAATGGMHLPWDWKRLERGELPALPGRADGWVISLVPTQLQRLLANPGTAAWLRSLRLVFLGGGPAWPALLGAARDAGLPLAPSYGLTETAAMVAAQRPEEFWAGAEGLRPLPHATLALDGQGRLEVTGESVCRGVWPGWSVERTWATGDRAELLAGGCWRILGRGEQVIITGGRKVDAAVVEAALRDAGVWEDVVVLGIPDPEWGEIVVACHPDTPPAGDCAAALAGLAAWQRPRRYLPVAPWPRNAQGKVDRAELRRRACRDAGRGVG